MSINESNSVNLGWKEGIVLLFLFGITISISLGLAFKNIHNVHLRFYPEASSGLVIDTRNNLTIIVEMKDIVNNIHVTSMYLVNGNGERIEVTNITIVNELAEKVSIKGVTNRKIKLKLPLYVILETNIGNYTIPVALLEK